MDKMKNKWSSFTAKLRPAMNKAIISAVTVSTLAFGTVNIASAAESELKTVYHIYIEDNFMGTVSDKSQIDFFIEGKTRTFQEEYQDVEIEIGENLSFVPEQVFPSFVTDSNEQLIGKLDNELSVQANVSAIVIDEQEVAYVKNEEAVQNVIKNLKLEHVSAEQLADLEERKKTSDQALPALKENESRILDVRLTANVSFNEAKTDPKEILTVEEAVELLKNGTLEEKKYKVQSGDVLGAIANSHGLTLEELLSLNPSISQDTVLKPGQELNVTYLKPLTKVEVDKEIYVTEVVPYTKEVVTDATMLKGDTEVKQEGKDGVNGVTYRLTEQNGVVVQKEAIETAVIQKPVKEIMVEGTKVVPSRGTGSLTWPTSGGYVSSEMEYRWGKLHKGIDIARPRDRSIKAADNGRVVSAGFDGSYGNKIVIDHQNGYRTVYAHLASISVSPGQTVARGSEIGVMGSTGDSTGIHLHFEVYKNGNRINPRDAL